MPAIWIVPKRMNQKPRSVSLVRSASAIGAARQNAPQPNPTRKPGNTLKPLMRSINANPATPKPMHNAARAVVRAAPMR